MAKRYTGDKEWLNEALPEAQENVLSALKRYGLVLFTELNQPMRWQRDDLESLAYYIDKYTEALDVINDGFEETGYKWLQRLEVNIDDNTQNLDVVWENSDGELDVADSFLQEMEDKIEATVEEHYKTWEKEEA